MIIYISLIRNEHHLINTHACVLFHLLLVAMAMPETPEEKTGVYVVYTPASWVIFMISSPGARYHGLLSLAHRLHVQSLNFTDACVLCTFGCTSNFFNAVEAHATLSSRFMER